MFLKLYIALIRETLFTFVLPTFLGGGGGGGSLMAAARLTVSPHDLLFQLLRSNRPRANSFSRQLCFWSFHCSFLSENEKSEGDHL